MRVNKLLALHHGQHSNKVILSEQPRGVLSSYCSAQKSTPLFEFPKRENTTMWSFLKSIRQYGIPLQMTFHVMYRLSRFTFAGTAGLLNLAQSPKPRP